jgi:hypothetical protein
MLLEDRFRNGSSGQGSFYSFGGATMVRLCGTFQRMLAWVGIALVVVAILLAPNQGGNAYALTGGNCTDSSCNNGCSLMGGGGCPTNDATVCSTSTEGCDGCKCKRTGKSVTALRDMSCVALCLR